MDQKEYQKTYHKGWYARNKEARKKQIQNRRQELYAYVAELKQGLSCQRCGVNHPATLDFHHRDRAQKDFTIGGAANKGFSKKRLKEEVDKCDVLCSNCHRILHWEEQNIPE